MVIFFLLVLLFLHQFQDGQFQRMWWAQDGAPVHQIIIDRYKVNNVFQNRLVALFSDNEWPPRSPDLSVLWGHIKSRVNSSPPPFLNELSRQIIAEIDNLKENPNFVRNAVRAMKTRARICIQRSGRHMERVVL